MGRHVIVGTDASIGVPGLPSKDDIRTYLDQTENGEFSDECLDRIIADLSNPEAMQGQYVSALPDCNETLCLQEMLARYDLSLDAGEVFRDARLPVPTSDVLLRVHDTEVRPRMKHKFPCNNYDRLLIDYLHTSFENRHYANKSNNVVETEEFRTVATIYALLSGLTRPKLDAWLDSLNI